MRNKSRLILIAFITFILLNAGIRAARIQADSPWELPNSFRTTAPFRDEPAKAYEARSKILYGHWKHHPLDQYEYWRKQSPVWVYTLYAWFRVFGPGRLQGRLMVALTSLVTLALLFSMLRVETGPWPAFLGAAMLGLNYYYFLYTRVLLMESMLLMYIVLSALFIYTAGRRLVYLLPALAAWMLAFFVKQSAIVFLPGLMVSSFMLLGSPFNKATLKDRSRLLAWAAVLLILLAVAGAFMWPDFRVRFFVNTRRFLQFDPTWHSPIFMNIRPFRALGHIKQSFTWDGFMNGWVLMMPVAFCLCVLEVVFFARGLFTRKEETRPGEVFWLANLLSARAALSLTPHRVVRYHLVEFIPTVALAAYFVARLIKWSRLEEGARRERSLARVALALSAAAFLGFHSYYIVSFLAHPMYSVKKASRELKQAVGDKEAVMIGAWAPVLCLDTPYKYYYIKNIFNSDSAGRLRSFGITHLVMEKGWGEKGIKYYIEFFPGKYDKKQWIASTQVKGRKVSVYKVDP